MLFIKASTALVTGIIQLYLDAIVRLHHIPHLGEHALAGFGLLRQAATGGACDELANAGHAFVGSTDAVDDDLQSGLLNLGIIHKHLSLCHCQDDAHSWAKDKQ